MPRIVIRCLTRLALAGLLVVSCPAVSSDTPLRQLLSLERTDLSVAGVGGMGASLAQGGGSGTLVLEGGAGEVALALLYWNGLEIDDPGEGFSGGDGDYDEAEVVFGGVTVSGTRVAGEGFDDGWDGGPSKVTWRADVTHLVNGPGSYTLAGLADGAGHSVNGASLLVFHDDGNPANDRRVVLFEGQDSTGHALPGQFVWDHWMKVDYAGGRVEAVLHVSDGQSVHSDGEVDFDAYPGILPSADASISFDSPHTDGLPLWAGRSVPRMGNGRFGGGDGLWDIRRFDLVPLFPMPREYDLRLTYSGGTDHLSVHVLTLEQPIDQPSTLLPLPHDFGDVAVGASSAPQRFTFTNLRDHPVLVDAVTSGHSTMLLLQQDTCSGQEVASGASCSFELVCAPTSASPRTATPRVRWAPVDGGSLVSTEGQVHCSGVDEQLRARLSISPRQHYFPLQAAGTRSAPQRFTLASIGGATSTVQSLQLRDLINQGFLLEDDQCTGSALPPGSQCSFSLVFAPSADLDRRARATLRVGVGGIDPYPLEDVPIIGLAAPDPSAIFRDGFELP